MIVVGIKHGQSSTELKVAYPLEMGDLFRMALKHGRVSIYCPDSQILPPYAASIQRGLGNSKLETKAHYKSTPEQALLEAIKEAELWGLPDLEVNI